MAVITYGYDLVQNVRTLVVPASTSVQKVCIHNHEHATSKEVFIGNSEVTVDNGMHAVATATGEVQLLPGDDLYAITAQTGVNLRILVVR
ncbi:MAG: hypothetical protein EHM12_10110 [Dehalococcoidia bacterium]|jgi:hypothetical protein|nr:MAG: hypothetical protein EHM12_10110 [Dehalococcoidia bacterium]